MRTERFLTFSVKSLSMSEAALVSNGVQEMPEGVNKQGYLFKKSVKAGKGWKCSWFVLDSNGVLHYWKNQKARSASLQCSSPHHVALRAQDDDEEGSISLLLCTVKEGPQSEKTFCFEIISPDDRLTLRATNEPEYTYVHNHTSVMLMTSTTAIGLRCYGKLLQDSWQGTM